MKTLTLNTDILTESGIPEKFWNYGADTYLGSTDALLTSNLYVRGCERMLSSNMGLMFIGEHQSCKTFLLTYVLKCLLAKGHSVRYITLKHLTDLMIGAVEERERSFRVVSTDAQFLGVDCLEDDATKGEIDCFERLVTIRSDKGLPLLIASDLPSREFKNIFGNKTYRRLDNMTMEIRCELTGHALKQRKEKILKGLTRF
jgi:DNA replication protein DnaC